MPIQQYLMRETFEVLTNDADAVPNDIGEMPAPTSANLVSKGEVKGRITPGDSLEPDVQGAQKDTVIDVTSMWIGFFNVPDGFEIESGDYVKSTTDSTRFFIVQFIDRYPGGLNGHHYECRLQTSELTRNA